mgnify:CR=1 FL=1
MSSETASCAEEPGKLIPKASIAEAIEFADHFATADGKAHLVPAQLISANERPDSAYPFVLITGRQLEHWHTGAMTRPATVLSALEPQPVVTLCASDMKQLGIKPGDRVRVSSRRGQIELAARLDPALAEGQAFIPFAYSEAAANLLTNAALDPFGKIPEFKYCAVAITVLSPNAQ